MSGGAWDAAEAVGRLHPLAVHVPIGLLVLLVALELTARGDRREAAAAARRLALALFAAAGVFSALFGWLLSRGGGYDEGLLVWHQYGGFVLAAAGVVLLGLDRLRGVMPYRVCLVAACAGMVFTSHMGGSLTHGRDYLTEHLPPGLRRILDPRGAAGGAGDVFSDVVRPILELRCVACHGASKQKGGFRADTVEGLLKGGEAGPAIVPGDAASSRMVRLVTLPEGSDGRMPPGERPGVTAGELAVLRWWIDAGAPTGRTVAELEPPPAVKGAIAALVPGKIAAPEEHAAARGVLPAEQAAAVAGRLSGELGVVILPVVSGEPWLEANASLAGTNFGDAGIAKLAAAGANFRRLDFSGSAVGDAGLAHLRSFPNVRALNLARTRVTDAGLSNLAGLAFLESLNLHGTSVTDAGLGVIQALPQIRRVYLWQTKVTRGAAAALEAAFSNAAGVGQLRREIEALEAKIRAARIEVNVGLPEEATGAAQQPKPKPQ